MIIPIKCNIRREVIDVMFPGVSTLEYGFLLAYLAEKGRLAVFMNGQLYKVVAEQNSTGLVFEMAPFVRIRKDVYSNEIDDAQPALVEQYTSKRCHLNRTFLFIADPETTHYTSMMASNCFEK